ncbi:MAG: sugar ABC transporter ATP-binding protein [Acidobacteriaceae bacterium]|nr:sugar ABC transporter ATP-binding protein [Acidobacteriaceae bacterium]
MRGIRKSFEGNDVLKGVDFDVWPGEVHALVGENGAGKSTLMNILAGVHQPSGGTIEFDGRTNVVIPDEKSAQQLGISIVFQERSLFGHLNVAENIFAARQPNIFGHILRRRLQAEARRSLERIKLDLDPNTLVEELSPAQQQMVEIAKALSLEAKVIIFDEPTSSLTDKETQALFGVIRQLRSQGVGAIYISHRLEEIFQIADRVTVLKDGRWQGTTSVAETDTGDLVRRMVGRNLELRHNDAVAAHNPILLEVRGLSDPVSHPKALLKGISFNARAGEIVGFAGLAGAGRTELALSIIGIRPRGEGEIYVNGRRVTIRSPGEAIAAGVGYAFEDRKEGGLFLDMSIARNIAAAKLKRFGTWWLRDDRQSAVAVELQKSLRIACRDTSQLVQSLSGGNQQKVVLAKWLLANPKVLIVDEPTRGVDVGAKAEVHNLLYQVSREGAAVVVISSDLPEILAVSDRIYVMREGRITGELNRAEATEESVMRLASLTLPESV